MRFGQLLAVAIFVFAGKVYAERVTVINCAFETHETHALDALKEWINSRSVAGILVSDGIDGIYKARQVIDSGSMALLANSSAAQAIVSDQRIVRIETGRRDKRKVCAIIEGQLEFRKN